jgi:hypothetical protein
VGSGKLVGVLFNNSQLRSSVSSQLLCGFQPTMPLPSSFRLPYDPRGFVLQALLTSNYYRHHPQLDLIKTLKEDVAEMKKKEAQNEADVRGSVGKTNVIRLSKGPQGAHSISNGVSLCALSATNPAMLSGDTAPKCPCS